MEKGKQYFENNKDKQEQYLINEDTIITINNKSFSFHNSLKNRLPAPKHEEYYKIHFGTFVKEITKQIDWLNDFVEYETALNNCEAEPTLKEKYVAYSKLKMQYLNNLMFYNTEKEPNPIIKSQIKNLEEQITIIDNRLSELKEQFNQPPLKDTRISENKPVIFSLKPNFEDKNWQIQIIVEYSKELFFSTPAQWENLFSDVIQVFDTPIELNKNTTLADLRLFLDNLYNYGLIKANKINGIIEKVKAFSFNGLPVTSHQLTEAKRTLNYPNTKNLGIVRQIFKELNIIDLQQLTIVKKLTSNYP